MSTQPTHPPVYLVGSWPGDDQEAIIREQLEMYQSMGYQGPVVLVTGELRYDAKGKRLDWVAGPIEELRTSGTVRDVLRGGSRFARIAQRFGYWGEFRNYLDLAALRPIDGVPIEFDPKLAAEAAKAYEAARRLAPEYGFTDVRIVQGVPCVFDLLVFTVGMWSRRHEIEYIWRREMVRIQEATNGECEFQLESPVLFLATWAALLPGLRHLMADVTGKVIRREAMLLPEGARYRLHACIGNLDEMTLTVLPTVAALVEYFNGVVRHAAPGRELVAVHGPGPSAGHKVFTWPACYWALRRLRLPRGVKLAVGIVKYPATLQDITQARDNVERNAGRAGIPDDDVLDASLCGLRREGRDGRIEWYIRKFVFLSSRMLQRPRGRVTIEG